VARSVILEAFDMEKRQEDIKQLLELPQESDVWQLGLCQFHDWVYLACKAWQPWIIAIFSVTHRAVVGSFPFHIDLPTDDFLWSMIVLAARTPFPPLLPHRPFELQVRDDATGQALKPWVERLGIAVVLKDKMEVVEKALFEVGEEFYGPRRVEP
jgi:hypothetical protein